MSRKGFDFKTPKSEKRDFQEAILRLLQKQPMRNKEICEKLEEKSNRITYHLNKLIESGRIEKNDNVYAIVKSDPTKLDEFIFLAYEESKFSGKTLDELYKIIQKSSEDYKSLKREELKKILESRRQVWYNEKNNKYELIETIIGKRGFCVVCKKRITKNELKISLFTHGPWDGTNNYPMHAICKNKLHKYDYDDLSTSCSYCGLSLDKIYFSKKAESNSDQYLQSALSILFDDPFSQIFSKLEAENYQFGSIEDGDSYGFAHYKEKNGKQYHPYCFKIINKIEDKK